MCPTQEERARIKELLLDRFSDWPRVHEALKEHKLTRSQSSLERFFNGRSNSPRTLRMLATLLSTTPSALITQAKLAAPSSAHSFTSDATPTLKDPDAYRVAFQLWVEMTTRKIGLSIDLDYDLVIELYNSWYAFFRTGRELIKEIPLHRNPACPEMRHLVELSRGVLNDGLRPHLEKCQARYRAWLANGGDRSQGMSLPPQQAQRLYPQWNTLRDDLIATNQRLTGYLVALEMMIAPPQRLASTTKSTQKPKRARPPRRNKKP